MNYSGVILPFVILPHKHSLNPQGLVGYFYKLSALVYSRDFQLYSGQVESLLSLGLGLLSC